MTVEYLKKAQSDLVAVATPEGPMVLDRPGPYLVKVVLTDKDKTPVLRAQITRWVSPKTEAA